MRRRFTIAAAFGNVHGVYKASVSGPLCHMKRVSEPRATCQAGNVVLKPELLQDFHMPQREHGKSVVGRCQSSVRHERSFFGCERVECRLMHVLPLEDCQDYAREQIKKATGNDIERLVHLALKAYNDCFIMPRVPIGKPRSSMVRPLNFVFHGGSGSEKHHITTVYCSTTSMQVK